MNNNINLIINKAKKAKINQQGNITQCIQKSSDVEWCYVKFYKGY